MTVTELNVVTGAFSYTGKYIARRLLAIGKKVRTLTGHPNRPNPFGDKVAVAPLDFEQPRRLAKALEGVTTLYNTYWVRFPHGIGTFDKAVENTKTLLRAAKEAGVRRLVHVSVANPSEHSPLAYYRGKAIVEKAIMESGMSYAIVRPTLIFGVEDVLINNIAWLLRHFPFFAIPGRGDCRVQPVFAEEVAEIAVGAGESDANLLLNAAGPDIYTFEELVQLIRHQTRSKAKIIHVKPRLALFLCRMVGYLVNDVLLTSDELAGLMANHLVCDGSPTGRMRFSEWLAQNGQSVGTRYASELERHFR